MLTKQYFFHDTVYPKLTACQTIQEVSDTKGRQRDTVTANINQKAQKGMSLP
jgi:hypothetical protein